MAPAGTPTAVIDRIHQSVLRALALPEVKAQLAGQGIELATMNGEQFGAFIRQDIEKWTRVVKAAGIKVE